MKNYDLLRESIRNILTEAKCPACGNAAAYIGLNDVECPNKSCQFFSQRQADDVGGKSSSSSDIVRVNLNFDSVEFTDDGNTTEFWGFYFIDGVKMPARGDDRSWNYKDEVKQKVLELVKGKWPDAEDSIDDISDGVEGAIDELEGLRDKSDLIVGRVGDTFTVDTQ